MPTTLALGEAKKTGQIQGQSELHRKFKARLGHTVQTCLKIKSSSSIGDTYIQWFTLMKQKSRKGKGH